MRFFRCLLGFVLGLLASAALLYRLVRPVDPALDEALAEASRCNVLFVGPSYLEVGLKTELFDAEARALGHPLRSCKFTRSALRSYELKHDLEQLMAERWPALQKVAVDLTLFPSGIGFERQNWFNPRTVHWHTWDALPWLYGHYRTKKQSLGALAPIVAGHLQHVAMNYLGIGRGGVVLSGARWVERHAGWEGERKAPREVDRLPRSKKRVDLTDEEADAATRLLALEKARTRARRRYDDDAWARELEPIIRGHGFEPVFLYSPVFRNRVPPRPTRPGKKPLVFLDFDDPGRYPALYLADSRGRTSHLSREGAQHYSRLLAQEFVKLATEPREASEPEPAPARDERGKRPQRGKRDRPGKR